MSARPRSTRPRRAALVVALATLAFGNVDARAAGLDDAAYVSQNVPATLFCGQTATVSITMRNSGTSNWLRTTYRLRAQHPGGVSWGTSSVQPATNVSSGASTTFTFSVTAPATAGTHGFQWQMHNGAVFFGALTANRPITVICDGSNGYKVGYREVTGTALATLWSGGSRIVEDTAFSSPLVNHVETSTVFWNGQYLMYYRTPPTGGTISVATSGNGHTWDAYTSNPVFTAAAGKTVSAPNVMVDRDGAGRPRLTMVVEHCCFPETNVARSYSYDGFTWSAPVDIVVPTDGTFDEHNAGTPNIVRTPDGQYRVGYHGQCCTNPFSNALSVGFANGSTLDAPLTKTGPVIGNNRAVPVGWWATAGAGARDIVKEGAYWYMVMEGLRGYIICGVEELSSWGIARTTDPTFRTGWVFSSHSPVRTDRQGRACGEDMPRFQVVNGVPYVVVTAMQQFGDGGQPADQPVKRYRIEGSARGRIGVEFAGMARTANGLGYWEVTTQGHVYAYGNAQFHGSPAPAPSPVVGIAATASGNGYWISTRAGHIYAYGDAVHRGAAIDYAPLFPVVGIAAEAGGNGYWQVASDGGVFAFEAPFHGSMGGKPLNAPMVGIASTSAGDGYWLVASDGGIFNYNAPFHGSMGGRPLNQPVVGVAGAPNNGYWLLGKDGGIFAFPEGSQPFAGSTQGRLADMPDGTPAHAVAITSTPGSLGYGYWIQFRDGGILDLGPAGFHGDISFG